MDQLPSPIGPSAQIPLMEGCRRRFAEALAANASPWALTSLFPRLVHELETLPTIRDIKLGDTLRLLGQVGGPSKPGDTWDIFHAIPRNVLESLVLGTVAFDSSRAQQRVAGLRNDGPGVYVIGLSIVGRGGRFLNAKEMDTFIKNLETYMEGYKRSVRVNPPTQLSQRARDAASLVSKVDSAYGASATPGSPRFICDAANLEAAGHLLSSFQTRHKVMSVQDPTGNLYTVQSPQYVGCGRDVGKRIAAYDLGHHKTALTRVNKFFGLTVSLLHAQGLQPKVHIVTALRTWMPGQLAKAEMLIAALAGAYVTQDGFNLREAGGNGEYVPTGSWFTYEQYVFAETAYFADNTEMSMADLAKLDELRKLKPSLAAVDDGSLEQSSRDCVAAIVCLVSQAQVLHCEAIDAALEKQADCMAVLDD